MQASNLLMETISLMQARVILLKFKVRCWTAGVSKKIADAGVCHKRSSEAQDCLGIRFNHNWCSLQKAPNLSALGIGSVAPPVAPVVPPGVGDGIKQDGGGGCGGGGGLIFPSPAWSLDSLW